MKHELTELGKRVRVWQVMNGVSMNELCRMVRERTQAASPRSYIWSVLCGIRKSEKVTAALEDIIAGTENAARVAGGGKGADAGKLLNAKFSDDVSITVTYEVGQ